jgi:hypothetical protein
MYRLKDSFCELTIGSMDPDSLGNNSLMCPEQASNWLLHFVSHKFKRAAAAFQDVFRHGIDTAAYRTHKIVGKRNEQLLKFDYCKTSQKYIPTCNPRVIDNCSTESQVELGPLVSLLAEFLKITFTWYDPNNVATLRVGSTRTLSITYAAGITIDQLSYYYSQRLSDAAHNSDRVIVLGDDNTWWVAYGPNKQHRLTICVDFTKYDTTQLIGIIVTNAITWYMILNGNNGLDTKFQVRKGELLTMKETFLNFLRHWIGAQSTHGTCQVRHDPEFDRISERSRLSDAILDYKWAEGTCYEFTLREIFITDMPRRLTGSAMTALDGSLTTIRSCCRVYRTLVLSGMLKSSKPDLEGISGFVKKCFRELGLIAKVVVSTNKMDFDFLKYAPHKLTSTYYFDTLVPTPSCDTRGFFKRAARVSVTAVATCLYGRMIKDGKLLTSPRIVNSDMTVGPLQWALLEKDHKLLYCELTMFRKMASLNDVPLTGPYRTLRSYYYDSHEFRNDMKYVFPLRSPDYQYKALTTSVVNVPSTSVSRVESILNGDEEPCLELANACLPDPIYKEIIGKAWNRHHVDLLLSDDLSHMIRRYTTWFYKPSYAEFVDEEWVKGLIGKRIRSPMFTSFALSDYTGPQKHPPD